MYSCVYYCYLFLISSASVRSIPFLSFIVPIFPWNVPLASPIFFKWSLVFPILLFSSISFHWAWRKVFFNLSLLFFGALHSNGYIFPFLLCLSLLFFYQLFVRPPQTKKKKKIIFAFLFLGDDLDFCLLYNVMNFCP